MVVGEFTTEVDVLVIGAGPGGYVAAIRAAQLGKSVVIVDKDNVGGVCLNRGCIPSKALISAAHRYEEMQESSDMGIVAEQVKMDYSKVQSWKDSVVEKLTKGVEGLLKGNKVQIVSGEALFVEKDQVRVLSGYESNRYKFNHCIIATGSRPIELKAFPYGNRILSSTEALSLKEIPKSIIVIGGGYIGVELGQTYAKLGSDVTILEGADHILPGFEKPITQLVNKALKKRNVTIHTKALAQKAEQTDTEVTVTFQVGDEVKTVTAEYLLVTVGRKPNTDEFGLEGIGLQMDERGLIQVDHQCKTNIPNIYAIGDIVPGPALAHKASYEGKVAAEVIAGLPSAIDYKVIPAIVFSDPEIASVGLSESEAKDKGISITTGRFAYGANGRALSANKSEGIVKVVAEKDSGIILGAQITGYEASNLISEVALAIEMGATLEDLILTIHAHPTLAEMVMEAAEAAAGHGIHSLSK
ncbi:dihydrolipoyl dehydrogenase [Ammoniphilus sp. CFH 90114]|uniref:dihydrolipoyl dehydrogenase n=1 Tax=Ammoniphilus sp. CFH 90114 TaxID=2493665 RepID=UPI00100F703E|nr:dihydrolipoyl dehydrogenase [Ammoniphilus sp. CFH 90114]RXT15061.1 dihydrolipoyl dehydrogenase [Ammoniphilus sp. CFH 90114]